jgi:hypothetical protein
VVRVTHDIFTGSAGMDGSASGGWTHTVPDAVPVMGGRPERYAAARPATDRWHGFAWFVMSFVGLLFMAVVSKSALTLLLSWLGYV